MITKALSSKLVLLVIGLAAGSGILIPAGYASFHPVSSSEIADNTIQSVDIKDGEVKAADIGTDQVKVAEIAANAVGSSEIATDAVGSDEIATNAVGAAEIAANAVGSSEIATDAVGTEEIATSAVGASEIAADSVGASELMGVSNLIFAECTVTFTGGFGADSAVAKSCNVDGAGPGNVAIATGNRSEICIIITGATTTQSDVVNVNFRNVCSFGVSLSEMKVGIIVFDTFTIVPPPPK